MFPICSIPATLRSMSERQPQRPQVKTRDDLVKLMADAIRLQLTYLSNENAQAVADTILRTFKMAGLSIRSRRNRD